MAKPIKETPILEGIDAQRFTEATSVVKPEPQEVIQKAQETFEQFQSIAAFDI